MRPFNLEEAKDGKAVCARYGKNARIICFDARGTRKIIALVEVDLSERGCDEIVESPWSFREDGLMVEGFENDYDLMMKD